MQLAKNTFLTCLFIYTCFTVFAQYQVNGSAIQDNCNCYTLTPDKTQSAGSVLNTTPLNLTQPFDFIFNVFLGCKDANGADGMVFILQNSKTNVGNNGGGLGFYNLKPSIGIALDTYVNDTITEPNFNHNDPPYDHISIQANGVVRHGNDLAGPVRASATSDNIEDCQWHTLRIAWNPSTKMLQAFFDGALRVEANVDLINTIFENQPMVYWGFSASSGGLSNIQKFCTALNPSFVTNATNDGICAGNAIGFTDKSVSFAPIASYYWDMGDGTSSTQKDISSHTYREPGLYNVKMAIKGFDGCASDTVKKVITVGSIPNARFEIKDACSNTTPQLQIWSTDSVPSIGTTALWQIDGTTIQSENELPLTTLPPGNYALKSTITSDMGCGTDEVIQSFKIKEIPLVQSSVQDVCINKTYTFKASQVDNTTSVDKWFWKFNNDSLLEVQNPTKAFKKSGMYTAHTWAIAANGCSSDTITTTFKVVQAVAFAGNDTVVYANKPFQLSGSGNGLPLWSPASSLDRSDTFKPTANLTEDLQLSLKVTTPEGCMAQDIVNIKVVNKQQILVPTAFTPNGNGLNDQLRPHYFGIKKLINFSVYNRWGERIFSTSDIMKGWDGRVYNKDASADTYIWMIQAEDIGGKLNHAKGTFTLIR